MRDYRDVMLVARAGTTCDASTAARVEAAARRVRGPRRATVFAAGTALAAAASLLWLLRPLPVLDRSLDHAGPLALGSFVQVDAEGTGAITGDERAMQVDWQSGRLSVEVEPDRGVGLTIHTPDGVVRVVGTGFDVDSDVLGTTVTVRHGQVDVECLSGASAHVRSGATHVCRPPTAVGALGRATALRSEVSPDALIEELDRALALPDATGSVASELHVLRVSALVAVNRSQDALADAEAALALPAVSRAEELHRFAARLRLALDDCAGARPHLEALAAAGTLGDDAPAWEACSAAP